MILMIDNYDSFTYNLVQYLLMLGTEVDVVRNDRLSLGDIRKRNPKGLVISPGPCRPEDAGICIEAIQAFSGKIPLLGVCLGHQAIAVAFGGKVIGARQLMHGKVPTGNPSTAAFKAPFRLCATIPWRSRGNICRHA